MSRQIEIAVGVLTIVIASIVMVVFGLAEQNRMARFEEEQLASSIENGAALFATNCSGCHGPQGKGVEGIAPALNEANFFTNRMQEVGWTGTFENYIESTIAAGRLVSTRPQYVGGGRPAMPAWGEEFGGPLRQDQVLDLAKFIINWEESALGDVEVVVVGTPTPVADDPVTRGRIVYDQNGCGACHAIPGVSEGVVGPNLGRIGELAATRVDGLDAPEYIRQSIVNPNAYLVEGFAEGIMVQTYGDTLSTQQLDDLVAFLLEQK